MKLLPILLQRVVCHLPCTAGRLIRTLCMQAHHRRGSSSSGASGAATSVSNPLNSNSPTAFKSLSQEATIVCLDGGAPSGDAAAVSTLSSKPLRVCTVTMFHYHLHHCRVGAASFSQSI